MEQIFFISEPAARVAFCTSFLLLTGGVEAEARPSLVSGSEEPVLTSKIVFIVGKSTPAPAGARERLNALKGLLADVPPSDASALLTFAASPRPPEFSPPLWHVLVNDTFDVLLRQRHPTSRLGGELLRLAERDDDPVLRDYALQKLDKLALSSPSEALRNEILAAFSKAAAQHGTHFQGTVLLTWQRAAAALPEAFDRREFGKAVLACLNASDATGPAKAAALQAGASAGFREIAVPARMLLQHPESILTVKISALHALGAIGGKEDIPLIRQYNNVLGCEKAVQSALAKL